MNTEELRWYFCNNYGSHVNRKALELVQTLETILSIINDPDAPIRGELKPSSDTVHDYYNRVIIALTR